MNTEASQEPGSAAAVGANYDLVANEYARRIYGELAVKPFDRAFLNQFAARVPAGVVLDLGCGPGQVGRYLHDCGVSVRGLDVSSEMIRIARELNPGIEFETGDMSQLRFAEHSLAGVVAFYSIIHYKLSELPAVFMELRRVLQHGGLLALSFHVGDEVRHVDELWGVKTALDFVFHQPAHIAEELQACGIDIVEQSERAPYDPSVEVQTQRCYLLARTSQGKSSAKSAAVL